MRLSAWMRGFIEYYQKPEAYKDIYAPELFPDVVKAGMNFLTSPTERNYAQWLRNLLVWSPVTRLGLGGYFFAPIGPFGELYDYTNPEGWIAPAIDWKSVYTDDAPVYMMSLLRVGADDVTVATNCGDHPAFVPVDGRRLASASNLPWLIAETNINGEWYRESAVRDAATLTSVALESLPALEVMIAVQIMASPETGHLSIHQGNHNNYSLQVTEMVATIGDDDIHQAKEFFKQKSQYVEWITVEATPDSNPYWTFENINRCRAQGYASAMRQFLNSPKLAPYIKHWPDPGKKTPATADVEGVHRLATTRSNRRAATS